MIKKILIFVSAFGFVLVLAVRINAIVAEANKVVFNPAREIQQAQVQEPEIESNIAIFVKNGQSDIICSTARRIKVGDKLSTGGTVLSVSLTPNLDTGICRITTNAPDGEAVIESKK